PSGALGFGALTIASIIGLLIGSTNKIEALLSPLGPVTFLSLTILVLAASSIAKPGKMCLRWVFYAVTGILGLIALYQSLGMGKLMFPQISYLQDSLWTPTGSTTTMIALFLITLSLLIPETIASFKKRQEHGTVALLVISLIIIAIGTIVTLFQFIPKMTTGVLPFDVGMVVASQIFKNPTVAVVGVGVENFVTAFTMGRPMSLNVTPLAAVIFGTNADFFLHILTVYGLIGLAASLVMAGCLLSGDKKEWFFITRCICIAGLILIPPTIALLTVIAVIFVLAHNEEKQPSKPLTVKPWIRVSAGSLLMLASGASLYFLIRAYSAEVFFFRSLLAAEMNDGTKTYNQQIRAIETNTFLSRYHITYSQTSLSLANSIASSLKNDQDRQLVAQLVQQAIREAKIAVTLNANNVAAWENLGLTYQTIMPVASEAGSWAITAYNSAAALDPSNPTLFVNIGGVFINQQQYDNAIAAFQQAIRLNPGYANAYYNVANAYALKGDTGNAAAALTDTMKLVEPGSTDYYKVKNELDAIQHTQTTTTIPPSSATGSSALTLP
ncbi:MAG: tetratricopeptide repeat protein, partial [Candidatus Gottesmanbacteria bacterium]|nr:tetratricopeptide repeat protein [Candidatus Gottesmanbacteria bacterium]